MLPTLLSSQSWNFQPCSRLLNSIGTSWMGEEQPFPKSCGILSHSWSSETKWTISFFSQCIIFKEQSSSDVGQRWEKFFRPYKNVKSSSQRAKLMPLETAKVHLWAILWWVIASSILLLQALRCIGKRRSQSDWDIFLSVDKEGNFKSFLGCV